MSSPADGDRQRGLDYWLSRLGEGHGKRPTQPWHHEPVRCTFRLLAPISQEAAVAGVTAWEL